MADFLTVPAFFIAGLTLLVNALLILLWKLRFKTYRQLPEELPFVSVLVAARDEAHNLPACLDHLLTTDYPAEKLEIWVGNDASSDETLAIASDYARRYDNVHVTDIPQDTAMTKGKARVLAHLARKAKGAYYLITDADILVPGGWVKGLLSAVEEKTGMVTGITTVKNTNLWSAFQQADWWLALGMVKVVTDSLLAVTAMGNNMLVSREAYEATGGYENIPFSVTEDFALLQAVRQQGFEIKHTIAPDVNVLTHAAGSWKELLHQRKRWMTGAMQLPIAITGVLSVQALFFPAFLLLFFIFPFIALTIWVIKIMLQAVFISQVAHRISQKKDILTLIVYESYSIVLSLSLMLFYFLPFPVKWKGREYKSFNPSS